MTDLPHPVEVSRNAFATPFSVTGKKVSGCLYRDTGTKIKLSERFGGWKGDLYISDNPDQLEPPHCIKALDGRTLYLGNYMRHYGHFITETLSSFWIFNHYPTHHFNRFALHSFVFGDSIPSWVEFFFSEFDIPINKLIIIDKEPQLFEEVYVPDRLFRLNHSADLSLASVYERISRKFQNDSISTSEERVYLSRRRQNFKSRKRIIANEYQVEHEFRRCGFKIIYPEQLGIQNQIRIYANSLCISGPSGSALHNIVFARELTTLIELADPRYRGKPAPNQQVCNILSKAVLLFVPFVGRVIGHDKVLLIDRHALRKRLAAYHLSRIEPLDSSYKFDLFDRMKGFGEMVFLVIRALLRDVLKKNAQ